jgi:hypothetical protein
MPASGTMAMGQPKLRLETRHYSLGRHLAIPDRHVPPFFIVIPAPDGPARGSLSQKGGVMTVPAERQLSFLEWIDADLRRHARRAAAIAASIAGGTPLPADAKPESQVGSPAQRRRQRRRVIVVVDDE